MNPRDLANQLRSNMSPPEKKLWEEHLKHGVRGHKFQPQVVIGRWIADFWCEGLLLDVEVDGAAYHDESKDVDRDEALAAFGVLTIRFPAFRIFKGVEGVYHDLMRVIPARERELQTRVDLKAYVAAVLESLRRREEDRFGQRARAEAMSARKTTTQLSPEEIRAALRSGWKGAKS